jgi:hypothetical protein
MVLDSGIAIKVKDNEKLLKTMGQIEAKLKDVGDSPVFLLPSEKLDRTMYLTEFYIEEGSIQYGAMGIDKDWFVIGLMPQTVTSFFHRLDGSIISWEPTEELKECLDEMPKSYHQVLLCRCPRRDTTGLQLARLRLPISPIGDLQQRRPGR